MRRRAATGFAGLTALTLLIAACGIPTGEDSFDSLADDEVPFRLAEESTTTSSTTTTMPPPTTPPDVPDTTAESTTTTLPTEIVDVYLLSRDGLQPVPGELPQEYGIAQLAALLEAGPPLGAAGVGLDTLIQPGLIGESGVEGGVVTVDLIDDVYELIRPEDLRAAMAQIVLTFTGNLRGVGQVSFTKEDTPLRVPKGNGILAEEGEPSRSTTTTSCSPTPPSDRAPRPSSRRPRQPPHRYLRRRRSRGTGATVPTREAGTLDQ